jgi:CRP/FNR family transcriptional regulator
MDGHTPPSGCAGCPVRRFAICDCVAGRHPEVPRISLAATGVIKARRTISRDGASGGQVHVIRDGWAFRYRALANGRRQILDFVLPGDAIGLVELYLGNVASAVEALTDVLLCVFDRGTIRDLLWKNPQYQDRIASDFAKRMIRYEDDLVDLGRRPALERLASFILKLRIRLMAHDMMAGNSLPFPLSQRHIAEATGLSPEHVSRMLKQLTDEQIIAQDGRNLHILDEAALIRASLLSEVDLRRVTAYSPPSHAA